MLLRWRRRDGATAAAAAAAAALVLCATCCYLASAASSASSASLHLLDTAQGDGYLREGPAAALSIEASVAISAVLAGLVPPYAISDDDSRQITAIKTSSLLRHPSAVCFMNIAGANGGRLRLLDVVPAAAARRQREVRVTPASTPGAPVTMAEGISDLRAANPDVRVHVLSQHSMPDCNDTCTSALFAELLSAAGARFTAAGDGGTDVITFQSGASLTLDSSEAVLFAQELLGIYASAKRTVQHVRQQEDGQKYDVFEASVVGLQALGDRFGYHSKLFTEAARLVGACFGELVALLDAAYDGDVVYQVALLADAPVKSPSPAALYEYGRHSTRQLLQAGNDTDPVKSFTRKAAGYGVFLLLLYFTIGGVYCMCFMKIKQDSLLTSTKVD